VSTRQVPVIFDPRVSRSLLGSFSSAISGAAIARGTSFLKDSLNQQVFHKDIQIMDDPHVKRGLGSRPFDSEGVATRQHGIVIDGVLQSWLLDVRSANQLGLKTTGNASRGLSSAPSPSTTNFYMLAGNVSAKELIEDIPDGFYVTELFGMGINLITGDYSQGASGLWIENGELTYPVSELTIAGNLKDMFMNLTPANDLVFRYATNAPTVRIDGMTVAGS
jgi:PmbA protein